MFPALHVRNAVGLSVTDVPGQGRQNSRHWENSYLDNSLIVINFKQKIPAGSAGTENSFSEIPRSDVVVVLVVV